MTVTITLETMKFHAFHGVRTEEQTVGGVYLTDIAYTIETDAVETDRLEDTVDYAVLFEIVKKEMTVPSQLIEHVAGRIMKAIKARFPQIQALVVKVTKRHPPVNGEMTSASVMLKG